MARGGTNGALDVGAYELAQGVPYVPASQFVLNAAATGFLLDPSSPDSGLVGTSINGLPIWSAYQTAAHGARVGNTWADYTTTLNVTYAFNNSLATQVVYNADGTVNVAYEAFDVAHQAGALAAMQQYADVSGLTFSLAADPELANRTWRYTVGSTNGGGSASYPGTSGVVNIGHVSWEPLPIPGTFELSVMLHEFGHGVGLPHPGDYNGNGATYANADHYTDSRQYSVMSYWGADVTGGTGNFLGTLGLYDILATQIEYGVNWTTRATDTVYGYHTNAGAAYDLNASNSNSFSIWDGGGNDTLDFSGSSGNTVMDLRQGGFSSTGTANYNVSIAYGAVVENAIGSNGNDRILGNSTANVLSGGRGNDVIFGGSETNAVASVDPRDFTGILLNEAPLVRNQYLSAGTNSSLAGGAFTIEMMVEITRSPASFIAFASYAVGGNADEVLIQGNNDGYLAVKIRGAEHITTIRTETLIDGNPHRLSVSFDEASRTLDTYVDGVLGDTFAYAIGTNLTIRSAGTLVFGQDQDSVGGGFATNQVLQGTIGDIRIFSDVRTAQEITANAFTRLTGSEQGLLNNWQVQAGTTTTVTDVAVANPRISLTDLPLPIAFTASQSSTYSSAYSASNILDNNNTSSNHTNASANEWVRLAFNQSLSVTEVEIINRDSNGTRLNGATVSLLDAAGNVIYTSAPISGANSGDTIHIVLPSAMTASSVRVDHHNQFLHIAELNVYGSPPAGYVIPPALLNTDLTIVNGATVHSTAPVIDLSLDNDTLSGGLGDDALYGGAGNDTIIGGGVQSTLAPFYAVNLNQSDTNQYLRVANYSGLSGTAGSVQFTLEMLVSGLSGYNEVLSYANSQTSNAFAITVTSAGVFAITYRNTVLTTAISAAGLLDGAEHRLSLSFDGRSTGDAASAGQGAFVIYVDGTAVGSGTIANWNNSLNGSGTLIFGQEQDSLGGSFDSSQILRASVSDIRVFNDIRTAQEVHDNAFTALTNVGGVQGLVNNWQVDGNSVAGHAVVDARGGPQLDLIGYSAPTLEALNGVSSVHLGAGRATAQGLYLDQFDGLAGGAFTVEMLVKFGPDAASNLTLMTYGPQWAVELEFVGGNLTMTVPGNAARYNSGVTFASLNNAQAHRISVSYDNASGAIAFYIDGVLMNSGTYTAGSDILPSGPIAFGHDLTYGGTTSLSGDDVVIGDIRVFNDIRSSQEIAANATAPLANPLSEQGLVANWEANGNTLSNGAVADAVGGRALTIVGLTGTAPALTRLGGWDDDSLYGGIGDDTLDGGLGSNALNGGGGWDRATYASITRAQATVTHNANGTTTVASAAGGFTDTLTGVEQVRFADRTVSVRENARTDANGDGTSDILLLDSNGYVVDWSIQNTGYQAASLIGGSAGWTVFTTGDFNGDGTADILMRNNTSNQVANWTVRDGVFLGSNLVSGDASGWSLVGAGDVNGDRTSDVVMQRDDGMVGVWVLNGGVPTGVAIGLAAGYTAAAIGDFNGDGTSDVLLRASDGRLVAWLMNNGAIQSGVYVGDGNGYTVEGAADFNGDGTSDILIRHASGLLFDLIMQDGIVTGYNTLGNAGTAHVAGLGDYNNNGVADILLQNGANLTVWSMGAGLVQGSPNVITTGIGGYTAFG